MTNFGKIKEMTKKQLADFICNVDAKFIDMVCEKYCESSGCEWKDIAKRANVEDEEYFLDICAKVCAKDIEQLEWWLSQDEDTEDRSKGE